MPELVALTGWWGMMLAVAAVFLPLVLAAFVLARASRRRRPAGKER